MNVYSQVNFQTSYSNYSNVPAGLLEAVAWTNTRMQHLSNNEQGCSGIPKPYGIMGLHDNGQNYFIENGAIIAQLSGVSISAQKSDPNLQILAYASAFDQLMAEEHLLQSSQTITGAKIRSVLAKLSEIPDSGMVNKLALDLQSHSIFTFLNDIDHANTYGFTPYHFNLTSIYGAANNAVLSSERITISAQGVLGNGQNYVVNTNKSTEYTPAIWNPAPTCNFSSRSGTPISAITIHTIQGTYAGAISWSQNCASSVSFHYVVRSSDGQITQMVLEADKGWHVGSENPYTIGYEHEGYVDNPVWYTQAMYTNSADLSRDIINSGYGIPALRTYYGASSTGTNVLGGCTKIKGHQHYPNQTHTDPGINWDWEKYYRLINNMPSINTITSTSGSFYDTGGASLDYNDDERNLWLFEPLNSSSITMDFTAFNLETNYDKLFVYDGNNIDAPLIGVYTGTNSPGSITSSTGALLFEFRSDCATTSSGWAANYNSIPDDVLPPVTTINNANIWHTTDFSIDYTDTDNISGVAQRFYLAGEENNTGEWSADPTLGFAHEQFENSINNWISQVGTYTTSAGAIQFNGVTEQNSNAYFSVDQNASDTLLYNWDQTILSAETNQRAGMHFFCDDATLPNRGNSYFLFLRETDNKIQLYKVDNDVFSVVAEANIDLLPNVKYNAKVLFNKASGKIDCFIDDNLLISWIDNTPHTTGNSVSFRTGGCDASFDNFYLFKPRNTSTTITVSSSGIFSKESVSASETGFVKSIVLDEINLVSSIDSSYFLVDLTPPTANFLNDGVGNDIDTFFTSTILANWDIEDIHSGILDFEYAVGTLPNLNNVIDWTLSGTNSALSELISNPIFDQVYHVSIRATNQAGLTNTFISNGQRYVEGLNTMQLSKSNVLIYPNPAHESVTITGVENAYLITILDAQGKKCKLLKGQDSYVLTDLAKGVYSVVIANQDSFLVQKLVIQ